MRIYMIFLLSTLFSLSFGAEQSVFEMQMPIGTVERLEGSVGIRHQNETVIMYALKGMSVKKGDELTVPQGAFVYVELSNGDTLKLDADTSVYFKDGTNIVQNSGKVFYTLRQENNELVLHIITPSNRIEIKKSTVIDLNEKKQEKKLQEIPKKTEPAIADKDTNTSVSAKAIANTAKVYGKRLKAEINNYGDEQQKQYEEYFTKMQKEKNGIENAFNDESESNASTLEQLTPVITEVKDKAIDTAKKKVKEEVKKKVQDIVQDKLKDTPLQ